MLREGISTYWLIGQGINSSTLAKIRHDGSITLNTLNDLCSVLQCPVWEIIEFVNTESEE
ncbi:helix-turn-helix domain-containing protein [Clostridium minihomine]|uniref:helix-turn-helix domain-containing protein n=1 Tax=Clostridium minihomine TaxID=2045012 RepID=UPI0035227C8F